MVWWTLGCTCLFQIWFPWCVCPGAGLLGHMAVLFSKPELHWISFPGGACGKEPACQCKRLKRHGFNPWIGKITWRSIWHPTPVFLPGESHGQRNLMVYSPCGCRVRHNLVTKTYIHTHTHTHTSLSWSSWKSWYWSWISSTVAIWGKELTHWKRPWCWERQKENRVAKDEMVKWHYSLSGHKF